MKWYWTKTAVIKIMVLLNGLLLSTVAFSASSPSISLLNQMRQATLSLNYELSFITITRGNIESLRYRHAIINDQTYAQLLQMDGASREVLMRGSEISYFFEQGIEPFSITGDYIVDAVPPVAFADFPRLESYYDFVLLGRGRVANRLCQVIRVSAKDGSRNSYSVCIDDKTKLPLQIELLDRNNEILEQFRVISFIVSDEVKNSIAGLANFQLPPLLPQAQNEPLSFYWKTSWLPEGFKEVSNSYRKLTNISAQVQTRLFSDGLFSFSVNIIPVEQENTAQYLHEGRRSIYTEVRAGHEIVVVGEIPQNTAKRIANGIVFGED